MAIDVSRLNSWLNNSKLQVTNNPLWQLLRAIIKFVQDNASEITSIQSVVPSGGADPNTVLHGSGEPLFRQIATEDVYDNAITTPKLSVTGVVAGSYTSTNLTVGVDGRLTAAANGSAVSTATDYTNSFLLMGA